MRTETINGAAVGVDVDVSLIRGGPFYRAEHAVRLIGSNEWNNGRRVTCAIAVTWLPLVLITALFNPQGLVSLLSDYRVHSRLLIAVPALLLGQSLMESRFRMVLRHIAESNLLEAGGCERMNRTINTLQRLRDSMLPELVVLLLVILHSAAYAASSIDTEPWLVYGTGSNLHLTPAGWYAGVVGATIFKFLMGLSLWKWLLWTMFAFRLSRLRLNLYPTHPDEHGGLGFLGLTSDAFLPISFAAATAIGGTWYHEILHHRATLMTFKVPAIVLLVVVATVALGPIACFAPRLTLLRQRGILEYGVLGQIQSRVFHEKWIDQRAGHETSFLAASEIGTLSAYHRTYEKLEVLKPFPADKIAFITLALSFVIPMLPAILTDIPLIVVIKGLLKALR